MNAIYEDGWLIVPCNDADTARVEIVVGRGEPVPAFRDWHDPGGEEHPYRVAKVRSEPVRGTVGLLVNGYRKSEYRIT